MVYGEVGLKGLIFVASQVMDELITCIADQAFKVISFNDLLKLETGGEFANTKHNTF